MNKIIDDDIYDTIKYLIPSIEEILKEFQKTHSNMALVNNELSPKHKSGSYYVSFGIFRIHYSLFIYTKENIRKMSCTLSLESESNILTNFSFSIGKTLPIGNADSYLFKSMLNELMFSDEEILKAVKCHINNLNSEEEL